MNLSKSLLNPCWDEASCICFDQTSMGRLTAVCKVGRLGGESLFCCNSHQIPNLSPFHGFVIHDLFIRYQKADICFVDISCGGAFRPKSKNLDLSKFSDITKRTSCRPEENKCVEIARNSNCLIVPQILGVGC